MKKTILLLILLLFIVISIFSLKYIIKKKKSVVHSSQIFYNPNYQIKNVKPKLLFQKIDTCNNAFRFDIVDSNIYLYKENETIQHNLFNKSFSKTYKYESVYTVFKNNDTINFFSENEKKIYKYLNGKLTNTQKVRVFWGNLINCDNVYYSTDTLTKQKNETRNRIVIKNNFNKVLFDITEFIKPYIKLVDKDCHSPYAAGILYNYSKDTIAYLFEHLDLLVLLNVNDGKTRELITQAKYKFIPYKALKVNDPISGFTMTKYEPAIEQEYIHSSFSSNNNFIFIRPDFVYTNKDKKTFEVIDVYSKHSFNYLGSIPFNTANNNESILEVRCSDNFVYILTSLGNIYSLSITNEKFN